MRDARNQFLAILNQRVIFQDLFVLVRLANRRGHRLTLRRPDYGAEPQSLGFKVDVGHVELSLERSHLAAKVFTRQESQSVVAGRKRQTGIVLKTAAA